MPRYLSDKERVCQVPQTRHTKVAASRAKKNHPRKRGGGISRARARSQALMSSFCLLPNASTSCPYHANPLHLLQLLTHTRTSINHLIRPSNHNYSPLSYAFPLSSCKRLLHDRPAFLVLSEASLQCRIRCPPHGDSRTAVLVPRLADPQAPRLYTKPQEAAWCGRMGYEGDMLSFSIDSPMK